MISLFPLTESTIGRNYQRSLLKVSTGIAQYMIVFLTAGFTQLAIFSSF